MAQQMPLPLTISCSSKSRLVLPFWYQPTRVIPDKIQKSCKTIVVVVVVVVVSLGFVVCFSWFITFFSVLSKRLSGKSVPEMTCFVSINQSINQSQSTTANDCAGADCRFMYLSRKSPATKNGSFTSPNFPGLYPRNADCLYEFIALPSERVHVTFTYFDVEGISPKCAPHHSGVFRIL